MMIIRKISHLFLEKTIEEKGFTLIEILIALIISTIALLGIANLLYQVIRGNIYSEKMTLALTRTQERIEEFRSTGYDALSETSGNDTPDPGLTRSWTVTDNSPASNMALITVTTSWIGVYGESHTVALRTIISQ